VGGEGGHGAPRRHHGRHRVPGRPPIPCRPPSLAATCLPSQQSEQLLPSALHPFPSPGPHAAVSSPDIRRRLPAQSDYIRDLLVGSDYPSLDFDAMEACFKVWELNKLRDITTYRDVAHASIFTGTMGVPDSEPWLQDGVEARGCGAGEKHAVGA